MGLYNSSTLSVEAILPTRGKELLSTDGTVNLTKLSLFEPAATNTSFKL